MFKRLIADVKEMFREQVDFRELLFQMVRRDLLIRYKQSVMGFGWAVFMPLVNTVIFSVVFMRVARIDVGMPYPLFAFTGLLAWNLTAMALRFSTGVSPEKGTSSSGPTAPCWVPTGQTAASCSRPSGTSGGTAASASVFRQKK